MWLHWTAADGKLMCTPWETAKMHCLGSGLGMLPFEWHHFQQEHMGNESDSEGLGSLNTTAVTLHALHAGGESDVPGLQEGFGLANQIVEIESLDELQGLGDLADHPYVFLDSLIHLDLKKEALTGSEQDAQSYQSAFQLCALLNTTAILNRYNIETWNDNGGLPVLKPEGADLPHKPARLKKGRIHRHLHIIGHT